MVKIDSTTKGLLVVIGGICVAALALFAFGTGTPSEETELQLISKADGPAEQIAAVDFGNAAVPRERVEEWRWQIDRLLAKLDGVSEQRICDSLVAAHNELSSKGVERDLRSIARAFDSMLPADGFSEPALFSGVLAGMVLREIDGEPLLVEDPSAKIPLHGFLER